MGRLIFNVPPEGAFSHAFEYRSLYWKIWFPGHCYLCHLLNAPADGAVPHARVPGSGAGTGMCAAGCQGCAYEDDTSRCGEHCEQRSDS